MVNWDDMRVFIAAARAKSFSAGGRRIGLDGSTVARRLLRLENALKATLFVRSPQGLQLTAAGGRLLQAALDVESAMEAASSEENQNAVSGLVRISVPDGLGVSVIAPALPAFLAERPALTIELVASSETLSASTREVDMTIAVSPPHSSRIIVALLTDFELGLFGSRDYLSEHGVPTRLEDLADHQFISYIDDLVSTSELLYLREIDFHVKARSMSTSLHARHALVRARGGLAILPHFLGGSDPLLDRVLPEIRLIRTFWISTYQDLESTARMRVVRRWLDSLMISEGHRLIPTEYLLGED